MADNTSTTLFNSVIYSVYVRNHTPAGDFKGLVNDLDRIKNLGIDTIWLMPVHPIGETDKKGPLGCPYSIRDYRSINPEYGTLEDFTTLLSEIHSRGLKCIIDVVYNHTSKDSVLTQTNPEYFIKSKESQFTSKIDDWNDVADFDFSNKKLWDELIDILDYWCCIGVDGFRCDVASLVPIEFWVKAREIITTKHPGTIFLAESCGLDFVEYIRSINYSINTDSQLFEAFDIEYDYDIIDAFYSLVNDKNYYPSDYAKRLFIQKNTYPENAVKLRFLENHDNARAAKIIPDFYELVNYTAMMFFEKGAALVYAGQELMEEKTPSLFEKDTMNLNLNDKRANFYEYFKKLISIKKETIFRDGFFYVAKCEDKNAFHCYYKHNDSIMDGVFNLRSNVKSITVDIPDGEYTNMINNNKFQIKNGKIKKEHLPAFFARKSV